MTGTAERQGRQAEEELVATRRRLIGFFQREARARCEQLVLTLGGDEASSPSGLGAALADAKVVRGAASVADLAAIATLAGHVERILKALHTRRLAWTPTLSVRLRAAASELLELVDSASDPGEEHQQRARTAAGELARYDATDRRPEADAVVPIARLFYDDAGPHILFVPVTPQTEFEQQLRALTARGAPGGVVRTPPPRPRPARRTPTAPRGHELHSLLGESVSRMKAAFGGELAEPVPIGQLLYSGAAALARAREIAQVVRARGIENSRDLLPELIDLLDLATTG